MIDSLFYNSYTLFSDENIEKIKNAKISIAGAGGVGCAAIEMLTRLGVNNFKIADPDSYQVQNLNRQLFATMATIDKNKAMCAKERILSINPNCNVQIYPEGVTLSNVADFCQDADIIMALNDTESIKVLLHKIGKINNIPVVMGSRTSVDKSRWSVMGKIWDYKANPELPTFGFTNHPDLDCYTFENLTQEILFEYDKHIKAKKIATFKNSAEISSDNYFKTISKDELKRKLDEVPDAYNRSVCSVIANIGGCLAATVALRYIIGCPQEEIKIDLI
ncbi:ThiF family adenylyltransferase [bacterium]|nr:ThiF family adenylyltransferase [bacterium]